jgi:hypothetical protein
MIIPTEARATMQVYREGRTLEQFLDHVWERRDDKQSGPKKAKGKWPKTFGSQPAKAPESRPGPKLRRAV